MRRLVALFTLGLLVAAPSAARADWLLTPFLGVSFGGDAEGQRVTYGGSVGYMGARVVGFEIDFSHAPEFLDDLLFPESNLTSLMGNVIVGVPIGGDEGSVRPYVVGGGGLLRTSVSDAEEFFDIDNSSFGINVGGGVRCSSTTESAFAATFAISGRCKTPRKTMSSTSISGCSISGGAPSV